jgi:flagellar basal-body rod protein FlgB
MQPIQLFDLASKQARWLSVREAAVAMNIANANTPAYRVKDVTPFSEMLDGKNAPFTMAATNPVHFVEINGNDPSVRTEATDDPVILPSGNNVGLATELMKTGEIKRDHDLNTGLVKAFNSMMLLTVRR